MKTKKETHVRIFPDDLETIDTIMKRESLANRSSAIHWVLWRLETLERLYVIVVGRDLSKEGKVKSKWLIDEKTGQKILVRDES